MTTEQCAWIYYRDSDILDNVTNKNVISEPYYEFIADGYGELRLVI